MNATKLGRVKFTRESPKRLHLRLMGGSPRLTEKTLAAGLAFAAALVTYAQEIPASLPTKEDLAKDNKLFITLASKALKWEEPTEPVKIAGPLYFVGNKNLS